MADEAESAAEVASNVVEAVVEGAVERAERAEEMAEAIADAALASEHARMISDLEERIVSCNSALEGAEAERQELRAQLAALGERTVAMQASLETLLALVPPPSPPPPTPEEPVEVTVTELPSEPVSESIPDAPPRPKRILL